MTLCSTCEGWLNPCHGNDTDLGDSFQVFIFSKIFFVAVVLPKTVVKIKNRFRFQSPPCEGNLCRSFYLLYCSWLNCHPFSWNVLTPDCCIWLSISCSSHQLWFVQNKMSYDNKPVMLVTISEFFLVENFAI